MEQTNFYQEVPDFYLRTIGNGSQNSLTITDMFSQSNQVVQPGNTELNKKINLIKQNNIWKHRSKITVNGQALYLIIDHISNNGFYSTRVQLGRKTIMGSLRKICGYKSKNYTYINPAYNIDLMIPEDLEESKIHISPRPVSIKFNPKNIDLKDAI